MAINFPDSPTNGQSATLGGNTWTYNSTSGAWARASSAGGSSITTYDSTTDLPLSGVDAGDQAFVTGSNRMYVSNGTGWYSVSLVNTNPSITSVQDSDGGATPFTLATDGTGTVITVTANDPEDVPLTYSYSVTSGSLTNGGGTTATVVQGTDSDVNKFTVTPSSTEAYAGTFELTFTASDGINTGTSANSFTLQFITTVTNSKYTTLLATATGTSDNNNITDASSNSHTITVNGDTHAGTFSPYRSGGYSVLIPNGDADNLVIADDASFDIYDGDFTVEAWLYVTSFNASQNHWLSKGGNTTREWSFTLNSTQITAYWTTDGTSSTDSTVTVSSTNSINEWMHICVKKSGSTLTIYKNGVSLGTGTFTSIYNGSGTVKVGRLMDFTGISHSFNGYISDLRIVKGTAITPSSGGPTERLEAVTNTSLLTCHLPYIADGSTNDHSITVNGNTSTKPFSPYDYEEYTVAANGGSVFFDGDPDHLQGPSVDLMGSGAFTVECWAYILSTITNSTDAFLAQYQTNNKFIFGVKADVVRVWMAAVEVRVGTTNITNNGWHHFALVRDGNNSCQLYIDGNEEGAAFTNSTDFSTSLENFQIGSWDGGTNSDLHGYISDLRVVKGTAVYTSAFTPPTAPLSTISGTTLHVKGTDASIIDKSQGANLKLYGGTAGSTTTKITGAKSIYIDGPNGDYISLPASDNYKLGTGDFTLETWVKVLLVSNDSGRRRIFNQIDSTSSTTGQLELMVYPDGYFYVRSGSNIFATTTDFSDGSWYHLALVRHNSVLKVYVDGSLENSANNTDDFSPSAISPIIGRAASTAANSRFQGYIQDFRITKGLARYTTNFTPPTASLEG